MTTHLVQIGNSQGIRIPKFLIEQLGFSVGESLKLEVEGKKLVLSTEDPKALWPQAFREMAANGDDVLIDDFILTDFDNNEWEW